MAGLDADDMDWEEQQPVLDQERRRRAIDKLGKGMGPQVDPNRPKMSDADAKAILDQVLHLAAGNKITKENAFTIDAAGALYQMVCSESAKEFGEQHFQTAALSLDATVRFYDKRVEILYKNAYNTLRVKKGSGVDDSDDEGDEGNDTDKRDQQEGTEGEAEAGGAARKTKAKARSAETLDMAATLKDDKDLNQRVKEPTFDQDPAFNRTSRLMDENSPQGLLLHNLPVFSGPNITFNADSKPEELLEAARKQGPSDVMVDLSILTDVMQQLALSCRATINPGIGRLYNMLKGQPALPGLAVLGTLDPEAVLRDAIAENRRAETAAYVAAAQNRVVQQAEDAMDVDDDNGGEDTAGPVDNYGADDGQADAAGFASGGGEDGAGFTRADSGAGGAFDAGDAYGGGDGHDEAGGGSEDGNAADTQQAGPSHRGMQGYGDASHAARADSGDESDIRSLLSSLALGGSGEAQSSMAGSKPWWRTRNGRKLTGAAAGAKPRNKKVKPAEEPLDLSGPPNVQLVDPSAFCYARKRPANKALLPREEPVRPEALYGFFSWPCSGGCSGTGSSAWGGSALGGGDVREVWRALLLAAATRKSQRGRDARAAAAGKAVADGGMAATPGKWPVPGLAPDGEGPAASETQGASTCDTHAYGNDGGFEDDGGGAYGGGGPDEYDANDDEDGGNQAGPDQSRQTLEELLQPRQRVQRIAVKYDQTAGVADVRTLKTNLQSTLEQLAAGDQPHGTHPPRAGAATSPPAPMPFQAVLDRLSLTSAAASGPRSLDGVSPALALICLLHLANDHGLALAAEQDGPDGGDSLYVTGLGKLVPAR